MTQRIPPRSIRLLAALLAALTFWPHKFVAQESRGKRGVRFRRESHQPTLPGMRARRRSPLGGAAVPTYGAGQADEQEDLTGTYKGQIEFPGKSLAGDTVLTVDGNTFTLKTADSDPVEGRISAVTTRGYTAVALKFHDKTISARLIRTGTGIRLENIPGQPKLFILVCDCNSCRDPVRCNCC